MPHAKYFLFCGLLGFLVSCNLSMPQEEITEHILPTPSLDASLKAALENRFFTEDQWPEKNWWVQYGSHELNELMQIALKNNPTIERISQKIEFAKSQTTIARSKLLPLLFFDASDQWQHLSKNGLYRALNPDIAINTNLIDFSLSFSYEFDFWGKYRNLYEAAIGKQKAAIAETAQVELITTTALAQAYFALKTNFIRRDLYQQLYETRKDFFDLQIQMFHHSLYSKLVPLLSEEKVFEAEQWVYDIEQEIAVGKHILNTLAGRGPDEPLLLDKILPELPKQLAIPADISTELLSRRPDLMAQIWRVDALAHEVGAAKADFWPSINLSALAGLESTSWSKIFNWASKTIGLIPGFSLPLYTAGAIGANVSGKKAQFLEAVYEYNDLILQCFQQVANLFAIGKAVYEKRERQLQIVANAVERYDLTQLLLQQGVDSALDAYELLEEQIHMQLADVELLYQQYLVSVNLIKALGGGYLNP
jgi:NodT family efflux transporter outer membrane factor (OMF) lipoprotein